MTSAHPTPGCNAMRRGPTTRAAIRPGRPPVPSVPVRRLRRFACSSSRTWPRVQQLLRELIHEPGRLEVAGLAETEQDAVALYDQLLPQAVIVDLNLKSGTGLGVIASLRRRPPGAARPLLIVLTNHALPVLEAACLKAGADYFLDKSRDFHKVRTLLDHACSRLGALPDAPASDSGAGTPSSGTTMH